MNSLRIVRVAFCRAVLPQMIFQRESLKNLLFRHFYVYSGAREQFYLPNHGRLSAIDK